MSKIKQVAEELVQPILEHYDLELFDIEYVKEGQDLFLRIFIDKEDGVTLEECELVSTELSDHLDEVDAIQGAYFLEVSSPGVERPLKTKEDFAKSVGEHVYVTLYGHIEGEKELQGLLKSFDNDNAMIEYQVLARKKLINIPYDKIAKARLAVAL